MPKHLWLFNLISFFALPLCATANWSDAELGLLQSLSIQSLPTTVSDPSNRVIDNADAIKLGHRLFFDKRLSKNGQVNCATCHQPDKFFTDERKLGKGIGDTRRHTPTIIGIAHSPWFFWDGRSDSLWSQALGPLEAGVEHGGNRLQYAHLIYNDARYKSAYENIFGKLPELSDTKKFPDHASPSGSDEEQANWQNMSPNDRDQINVVFSNIGKAIAAYETQLVPAASRFDRYVHSLHNKDKQLDILNKTEIAGLKLFTGKGKCITCHVGPLFTNHSFHNIGTPHPPSQKPAYIPAIIYLYMNKPVADHGRYDGLPLAQQSKFNCLGKYSDAEESACAELKYANPDHRVTLGAFKVPTLRNASRTAPYMHSGVFDSLEQVINHYNRAPMAAVGHSELTPLNLSKNETQALIAFLKTLESPIAAPKALLKPP